MLLREYDRWATDHPDNATKRSGVVFFTYLQKERSDLLDFHAAQTTDLQLKNQLEEMAEGWDKLAREGRQGIVENNPDQT